MTAADTLAALAAAGVTLSLDPAGRLVARPRERLTDDLRAAIRANLAELTAHAGVAPPDPCPPEDLDAAVLRQLAAGAWRAEWGRERAATSRYIPLGRGSGG
jgi:hypothetical protein